MNKISNFIKENGSTVMGITLAIVGFGAIAYFATYMLYGLLTGYIHMIHYKRQPTIYQLNIAKVKPL